jgi:hypothetical protein
MFAHIRMRPAASGPRGTASILRSLGQPWAACVLALVTAACSAPIPAAPLAGRNPADADAPAPAAAYRSVTRPYRGARPVEPKPWTEQNQRVAPAEKP